ncbi:hypothetical protein [Streptomyces sp. NPDC086777]|uniref:hypothetical protein n=1 Tax=Streptomyces sp. NPDC086777 TaxID=3154866 RepID=UPI00345018D9
MNDGAWGDEDTGDLVADRLKFIGALLAEDTANGADLAIVEETAGAVRAGEAEGGSESVRGKEAGGVAEAPGARWVEGAVKGEVPGVMTDGSSPVEGERAPARRRRHRKVLAGSLGLAAAVAAAAVLTAVWAPWSADSDSDAKPDQSGLVACAKLIVEGTVAGTDSAGGGKVAVRLDVERYVKPGKGPGEVRFEVPREDATAYRTGARVLVGVSRFDDEVPLLFTGSEIAPAEEWMAAEAGRPDAPACPGRS